MIECFIEDLECFFMGSGATKEFPNLIYTDSLSFWSENFC